MVGGSALGIGVTMFLRDQFSGPAARVRSSAAMTTMELRKMQEQQLRSQRNMYAGLAMAGAMGLRGIMRTVKVGAKFGYEMEFVKSITNATIAQQMKLGSVAKDLAGATMFFPKDVAEGMRFMAMAGMDVSEVLGNITGAVNLAGATMAQLGGKGGAPGISDLGSLLWAWPV